MSNTQPNSYEPYVLATFEQLRRHIAALDELVALMGEQELTFNERSACERHIQVIVEMAIGVSKHMLKTKGRPVPAEARLAIQDAYEAASIKNVRRDSLRGAVGMRNVIIHDYLNVSWPEIESVLKLKVYYEVQSYIRLMGKKLLEF